MTKKNTFKILGLIASVVSIGASLMTDWVNEQKLDEKIEEKVEEALAQRSKVEKEES